MEDVRRIERVSDPRQHGNGLPLLTWTILGARVRAAALVAATAALASEAGVNIAGDGRHSAPGICAGEFR